MEKKIYSKDESAIESLYGQLINYWNEMNARAFADLFSENGSIVGFDGSMANGREKIFEHLSSIFSDHSPAKFVTIIREIRLLSDSAGLLRATVGMVPRGEHKINPKTNAIQSLVVAKENGKFYIALFQNTPAAFHGRPELAKELTEDLEEQLQS